MAREVLTDKNGLATGVSYVSKDDLQEYQVNGKAVILGASSCETARIMPRTATLISGDKTGAYKYLPESVNTFISRDAMQDRMKQAGFSDIVARPLTFGICVCYRGIRK